MANKLKSPVNLVYDWLKANKPLPACGYYEIYADICLEDRPAVISHLQANGYDAKIIDAGSTFRIYYSKIPQRV